VLEHQVAPPHLAVALLDGGDVAPLRGDPSLPADGLDGVEYGLVGCFAAARVLLAGMDVPRSPNASIMCSPMKRLNHAFHSSFLTGAWVRHDV
jgi:hypothetical protein